MLLKGKNAIVTGANRGIGFKVAELFCQQGARVFVNGRNTEEVQTAVDNLKSKGFLAEPFICDVSNPQNVSQAFKEFFKVTRELNVLVNNAGILDDALIGMVTPAQVQNTFSANSFSVLYTSQYASRIMSRRNSGSIINLASIIGTNGNAGQAVYGGSKAAVIGITQSLAKELAPANVRVNAIAPGFIDTEMARSIPEEKFQERLSSIAMQRIGEPDEIAQVALFLASDMSSYVTGQVIGVDGGMLI